MAEACSQNLTYVEVVCAGLRNLCYETEGLFGVGDVGKAGWAGWDTVLMCDIGT